MAVKKCKRGRPKKKLPSFCLPSDYNTLDSYIKNHKIELMERVLDCIEHAKKNNLSKVEVFKFSDSKYTVTLNEDDFLENAIDIYETYLGGEYYEYCNRAHKLISKLNHE